MYAACICVRVGYSSKRSFAKVSVRIFEEKGKWKNGRREGREEKRKIMKSAIPRGICAMVEYISLVKRGSIDILPGRRKNWARF